MGDFGPMSHALDAQSALAQAQTRKLAPPSVPPGSDPLVARQKAQEFEGVFLAQMIGHMWTDLPTDSRFRGGFAENIWRQHMWKAMGEELAASGGVGLAEQVHGQILIGMGVPPEEALQQAADAARAGGQINARSNAVRVDNTDAVAIAAARSETLNPRAHPAMLDAQGALAAQAEAGASPVAAAAAYRAQTSKGE